MIRIKNKANTNALPFWALILSFIIILGAGHGIIPLGYLEILWLNSLFGADDFAFSSGITTGVCIALIGQIPLLTSLFIRDSRDAVWFQVIGVVLLWVSLVFVDSDMDTSIVSSILLASPFLIVSSKLLYRIADNK